MPKELDDIEDLPSSEQATLDDDQIGDLGEDAGSSTAADETPKDTLSVVRDVVAASQETETPEPGSSPEGEEEPVASADAKATDDEDYTDVPFHKHPRFQHLLREKKANETDAQRYRNVQSFIDRAGLEAQEAADALQIMALAKTDPVAAWEQIKPWAEKVAIAAGVILPQDLQERVQRGEMPREAAIEVSRARAQVAATQTRTQFATEQAQRRMQQEAQQAIVGTAEAWEADRQTKDPNFAAKLPSLQREIAYLHATEGKPTTPQGVQDQLNRAYQAVNAAYRPPQPAARPVVSKPAVRPVTGGQVAGNAAPEPKSTLEIIQRVRAGRKT